ncbi:MAG: 6-carboxytetrahydropterin synthase QueD [Myxococcales bacterium FL481]|nr:MAG: 6-carboxytetrahydropterin synthase QueD [Myxococcales bacterium FL481]
MAAIYRLKTHVDFSSAHQLRGYDGPCARLHGHNYRLEVEVEANGLDDIGLAVDFRTIREAAREHVADLDHRNLNEIPPFDELNPTAENLAMVLYRRLSATLDSERVWVAAVTISETDRSSVRYSER